LRLGAGADSEEAIPSVPTPSSTVCGAMVPAAAPTLGCVGGSWWSPSRFELVWAPRGDARERGAGPAEEFLSSVPTSTMPCWCRMGTAAAAAACCVVWFWWTFPPVSSRLDAPGRGGKSLVRGVFRRYQPRVRHGGVGGMQQRRTPRASGLEPLGPLACLKILVQTARKRVFEARDVGVTGRAGTGSPPPCTN
jgi:hypothetical protein